MLNLIGGPAILIFIGVVISGAGAIWASIEQSQSEKQLREKAEEIARKSDDLVTKSNEITELNKKISQSITGGNSFAYLQPSYLSGGVFPESLMLIHQGEYPLYDISIRVVDLDEFESELAKPKGSANLMTVGSNLNIGNLSPKTASFSGVAIKEKSIIRINVFFTARNGTFSEQIRIAKVGNEYKVALQVSGLDSTQPLFEKIDEGYPVSADGGVTW